ncbi:MAG: hypothetical protein QOE83_500 [Actinomycetota bacterium]|nr:hypothetical protein [Actinomycetota bacterium]
MRQLSRSGRSVRRTMRAVTKTAGRISLATVLVCATITFGVGVAWKSYCAGGDWSDTRQYTTECYSDIVPLLGTEQLGAGRLPFVEACAKFQNECDEYPVLTMYFMRAAAGLAGGNVTAFFWANVMMLWLCAMVVAACCYFMVGKRALYVALAPTLLLSGVLNWDLFAIALSTLGLLYFFTRRDVASGAFMGLGAAAKFFPALLVIPLVVDRVRSREPDRAIRLAWSAAGTWLVTNIPFALIALASWWEFFRFNSSRTADYDSLWYIAYRQLGGDALLHTSLINVASGVLFLLGVALIWVLKARRHPTFPRWTLGFPVLVLFLLTNKVYSPQYSLFLLAWFALALPTLWGFILFELADVLVYLTRFKWFATFDGLPGPSQAVFETMVALRAIVLIGCVVAWVLYEARPLPIQIAGPGREDPAPPIDPEPAVPVVTSTEEVPELNVSAPPGTGTKAPDRHGTTGLALAFVVMLTVLVGAYWVKDRCTNTPWDGRQYTHICANDIMVLYYENHYDAASTFPPSHVEYPPLLVFSIAATRELASSAAGFLAVNAIGLSIAGLACLACLIYLAPGRRVWLFVLAPASFLYAFQNWDLFAIALGLGGLVAASGRRYRLSGLLLGLGAATKLFPALILPGIYLAVRAEESPKEARRVAASFFLGALIPNLVLYLLSSASWKYFWTFQSARFPNPETSWFMIFRHLEGNPFITGWWQRDYPSFTNLVGTLLCIAVGGWLIVRESRRSSPRPIALSFALIIAFLLFTKVFSPQYMLWLLPFLVLLKVPRAAVIAFIVADVSVFVAINAYYLSIVRSGDWPLHLDLLEMTVWFRYAVLAWLLYLAVAGSREDPPLLQRKPSTALALP